MLYIHIYIYMYDKPAERAFGGPREIARVKQRGKAVK